MTHVFCLIKCIYTTYRLNLVLLISILMIFLAFHIRHKTFTIIALHIHAYELTECLATTITATTRCDNLFPPSSLSFSPILCPKSSVSNQTSILLEDRCQLQLLVVVYSSHCYLTTYI